MDRPDRTEAIDFEQQSQLAAPAASTRATSPSPSHRSNIPATPRAEPDAASDYFAPLGIGRSHGGSIRSNANSVRSRASAGVFARSDSSEQLRQPSIRIRRKSSTGTQRPVSNASLDALSFSQGFHDDPNRPRSLSQPERARLPQDGPPNPRYPRRVQDFAMPRLTEEGNRPTMEELGEARAASHGAPLSPTASLPEHHTYDDEPSESQDGRNHRFRGRKLWPGFGRKNDRHATPNPQQQAEEEYDEALVDYLDTIGESLNLNSRRNREHSPTLMPSFSQIPKYKLFQP